MKQFQGDKNEKASPRKEASPKNHTPNCNPIDLILPRLDRVKQIGPDKWQSLCPSHDDKSPSLSIRDVGDKALLTCWAGCTFADIAAAMGLEPWQFFADGKAPQPIRGTTVTPRKLYDALDVELRVAFIANRDRLAGRPVTGDDLAREKLAKQRIVKAWRAADGR